MSDVDTSMQDDASVDVNEDDPAEQAISNPLPEQKPEPIKRKIVIDGKEEEVDIDKIARDYQKYQAADKRFREAAEIQKRYGSFEERAKKGDFSWVKDLGADDHRLQAWMEQTLLDKIEYENLPEEQKRIKELERKLAEKEEFEKTAKEREAELKRQEAEYKAAQEIDIDISEAFKASGLKPSKILLKRTAEIMLASLSKQSEDGTTQRMDAASALKRAQYSLRQDAAEYFGEYLSRKDLPIDERRKILPKSFLDELRKSEVDRVRAQDPMRSPTRSTGKDNAVTRIDGKNKRRGTTDELFDQLERRLGG